MLRRLGKDLRMANWKVSVTLEMRDWVYGVYMPPRLIRIYPGAFHHASMGVAVDLGTTSVVAYLLDFASGRVIDSASAYNKQIACGDDVISRIIYAKRKKRPRSPAAPRRGDHQRPPHRAASSATTSSPTRSTRSPWPATRP